MNFNHRLERIARSVAPVIAFLITADEWGRCQVTRFDRWLASWSQQPTWNQPACIESIAPVDPAAWRVADLKELLALRGIQTPRKARKQELIALALS